MKEELEEGHFDTEGNYHWKKEGNIRDNWLENIDWVKVRSCCLHDVTVCTRLVNSDNRVYSTFLLLHTACIEMICE